METTHEPIVPYIKKYQHDGIQNVICTDISKDGMMKGPNVAETEDLANFSIIAVIASGGVRNLEDLKSLAESKKIFGAICGKSLYEGSLELDEAIKFFDKQ